MNLSAVQRILGLLLMVFSTSMLPPAVVAFFHADATVDDFLVSFAATALAGLSFWYPVRRQQRELRLRDGFLVVAGFWLGLSSFGSLPFYLSPAPLMSFTDSMFEAFSGLTTTGATVLTGLDALPPSILYYRAQLQWFGGMGIVVLAVAVLPMLGVGGMQLYRAEAPGPVKDTKLTPRITETAKALWYIYLGMTMLCGIAYWLAGMSPFDAICYSFTTVAIGGFANHDVSIRFFDNTAIELIAIAFMLLAGANFSLHFVAFRSRSVRPYLLDPEFRTYLRIIASISILVTVYLLWHDAYPTRQEALIRALFQVVSISTTTGYTTAEFAHWPGLVPVLLLFASFVGACAGSTGGGIKVIRCLLLYRQGVREVIRLVHPNAEIPVMVGNQTISQRVVDAVWGFFAVYVVVFATLMLVLLGNGVDQVTAFSAIAACLNNLGPGLGDVATTFANTNDLTKWVCIVAMVFGRLEIFTLLVLISPAFWRR